MRVLDMNLMCNNKCMNGYLLFVVEIVILDSFSSAIAACATSAAMFCQLDFGKTMLQLHKHNSHSHCAVFMLYGICNLLLATAWQ